MKDPFSLSSLAPWLFPSGKTPASHVIFPHQSSPRIFLAPHFCSIFCISNLYRNESRLMFICSFDHVNFRLTIEYDLPLPVCPSIDVE